MCNNLSSKFIELSEPHFNEPNEKSFKLLLFAFTKNLETFYKTHKKILTEFEEPLKVRLKKQEETFVETHIKKIYEENSHKLVKENLQRNSNVDSIMNAFHTQYQQRKAQDSKTIEIQSENIESPSTKYDQRFSLPEQKGRSKTISNHCSVVTELKSRTPNYKDQRSLKNITDINVSAFSQNSQKKIIFYKRNYTHIKNRQRNYSFHSETIDNTNDRHENMSACNYEEQKTARDHTELTSQERSIKDPFNETFRPFCGLNTKDIFVKRPTENKVNNPQQNSTLSDFKINFISRQTFRGRVNVKKQGANQFSGTFYQPNHIQHLRDDQESKLMMRQNILKISSNLAIKNPQPQGYRGKSRIRYRSLNEAK